MSEEPRDSDDAGDEITFKRMSIRIFCAKYSDTKHNRKSLELSGEVTVGDISSYSASLTFATEGITVTGGVSEVNIPGTDIVIEEAGLKAFLALKKGERPKKMPLKTGEEHTIQQAGGSVSETGSSFSILGVIRYHEVTFRAGFHVAKARQKNSKEKDWIVFGSAENVKLRNVWPSIDETSFLNLQIENVTVIASSQDKKRVQTSSKTQTAQEHTEDKTGQGAHASWDVLAEIEEYGYKVKKGKDKAFLFQYHCVCVCVCGQVLIRNDSGFQICATIPSFQQLEYLNHGQKIEGLQLSLCVGTEGDVSASIRLPSTFKVRRPKTCLRLNSRNNGSELTLPVHFATG